jgi:hypothetical protein
MRAPEWTSLCWLVESERETKKRKEEICPFREIEWELPRSVKHPLVP